MTGGTFAAASVALLLAGCATAPAARRKIAAPQPAGPGATAPRDRYLNPQEGALPKVHEH